MENIRRKSIGYQQPQYCKNLTVVKRDTEGLDEINRMLDTYIDLAKAREQPEWYVKFAAVYFTYHEKYYVIYPSRLNTSDEIFEIFATPIIDDLYTLGAYDMFYSGMLD